MAEQRLLGTSRIDDIIVSGALPLYVSGYQNLSVAGTSQAVTGSHYYYYRVRAESANSTSANSNIITAIICTPASAGTVSGSSPLCIGATATYSANAVVLQAEREPGAAATTMWPPWILIQDW